MCSIINYSSNQQQNPTMYKQGFPKLLFLSECLSKEPVINKYSKCINFILKYWIVSCG